jgi:hypothetical protein
LELASTGDPRPDDEALPKLWTLQEVADRTGLNYWWLRRACAHRQIEFTKAGRLYQMTAAQVRLAIDEARMPAVPRALPALPMSLPGIPPMDMSVPAGMEDIRDEILRERARRLAGRRRRSSDSTT